VSIIVAIIEEHLDQFLHFTMSTLRREAVSPAGDQ